MKKSYLLWGIWFVVTVALAVYLSKPLITGENQTMYLIGETTSGHHQIELECKVCHTDPFGGKEVLQSACLDCHKDELKKARDSHPIKKFTDPRNADRLEILDARYCVTCHREHREDLTGDMGLTLPKDYCYHCHQGIEEERDSHKGLAFDSCASAGCHNYHDNQALYEDFLLKHQSGNWLKEKFELLEIEKTIDEKKQVQTLSDMGIGGADKEVIYLEWQHSLHAQNDVTCLSCHGQDMAIKKPGVKECQSCHKDQFDTFSLGKHGMKLATGLPAMKVSEARVEMKESVDAHKTLSCNSCHLPHKEDTQFAAVEACQGCHDSEHVNNYPLSAHASLNVLENGAEVTCATCHMPKQVSEVTDKVFVNHNQNDNLRPNEKMIRSVCLSCHSLSFSIDALADPELIKKNFQGKPGKHIDSINMAIKRSLKLQAGDNAYRNL